MTTCSRSRCSRKLSYAPSHAIIVASAAYGDFFNCFDGDFRSMRSNGKQKIMGKITGGHLVQADETKARKRVRQVTYGCSKTHMKSFTGILNRVRRTSFTQ